MAQEASGNKVGKKKQPKFYPLTQEEWLKAVHDLKPAERDLLFYLRTLDPFGDRTLDLTMTDLAKALEVHKSTISRALKVLDSQQYIDLEMTSVRIRLRNRLNKVALLPANNLVVQTQQEGSLDNQSDREATDDAPAQQTRSLGNEHPLKPLSAGTFENSHTVHTDHTKHTLSKDEGERTKELFSEDGDPISDYRDWLIRKSRELPTKPAFLEQWLESQAIQEANQKDFLKYKSPREEIDPLRFSFDEGKTYKASSSDIIHNQALICKRAVDEGDIQRAIVILQNLWKDGLQDECREICDRFQNSGIEIGQHGPREKPLTDES